MPPLPFLPKGGKMAGLTDALSSLSGIAGQLANIYTNGVEAYTSSQARLAALDAIDQETVKTATPVVQTPDANQATAKAQEMNWTVIGLVAVAILGILLVILITNRRRG